MSSNNTGPDGVTANDVLSANEDFDTGLRLGIAASLGQTGFNSIDDDNPRRNLYETFGWPKSDLDNWDEENWVALYLRNGYAKTVNDRPAKTAWRDSPLVHDQPDMEDESEFERAVRLLNESHSFWNYIYRTDRLAGIGQHGLLVLGLSDVAGDDVDRQQWEADAREQTYSNGLDDITSLKPVLEMQIEDIQWGDPEDGERWGKPLYYTIDFDEDIDDESEDEEGYRRIHWSRVIDIPATAPLDDETLARPRAEPVLNNLLDIEKTLGSVAEAAFMSANQDLHLNSDPTEVDLSQGADELRDELMRYFEGQPYLRTQGMDVEQIDGQVQDPTGIIEANLDEIAATKGIPKTILRGNEAGEIEGANKDERDWFGTVEERREQYNTPYTVKDPLRRLIELGILPEPQGGTFTVSWPDLKQHSEQERANIHTQRTQAIANLGQVAPGVARRMADSEYIETGNLPQAGEADMELPDPEVEEMQGQFNQQMGIEANVSQVPPEKAAENARRGLECVESVDTDAGEAQGRDTARKIINAVENNEELSEGFIGEIASFDRHREQGNHTVDEEHEGTPCEDNGYVSWLLWGGDAGVDWAQRVNEKLSANKQSKYKADDGRELIMGSSDYAEGDEVDTPDGIGVVADEITQSFEEPGGNEIDASEDEPAYAVLVEDGRVGVGYYKASELRELADGIDVDVDGPTEDLAEVAANNDTSILGALANFLTGNQEGFFEWPDSWRKADQPARLIALKAFASMGGSFDGCEREMTGSVSSPQRFCADFIDRLVGHPYWRGDSWAPGD